MKVTFDGFVPYTSAQSYKCTRGCSGCSSSERIDSPVPYLDDDFYEKISNFFRTNQIGYQSISLNYCGDFLANFPTLLESIRIFAQHQILKKGLKLLLYTTAHSIKENPAKLQYLTKFQEYLEFQIGIPLIFSSEDQDLSSQIDMLKYIAGLIGVFSNINAHIVIQKKGRVGPIREDLYDEIKALFTDFRFTFAETEGEYISYSDFLGGITADPHITHCPFIENTYLDVSDDHFSFYMLDISHEGLRPHGPGCEKNKDLYVGDIDTDISEIQKKSLLLQGALKKMQDAYHRTQKEIPLCQYCRKNLNTYL